MEANKDKQEQHKVAANASEKSRDWIKGIFFIIIVFTMIITVPKMFQIIVSGGPKGTLDVIVTILGIICVLLGIASLRP